MHVINGGDIFFRNLREMFVISDHLWGKKREKGSDRKMSNFVKLGIVNVSFFLH